MLRALLAVLASLVNAMELVPVTLVALVLYSVVIESGLILVRLDFAVAELGLLLAGLDFAVMNLHLVPVPLNFFVVDFGLIAVDLYRVAAAIFLACLRAFPLRFLTEFVWVVTASVRVYSSSEHYPHLEIIILQSAAWMGAFNLEK